jgi:hypothetical protein
MTTRPFVALLVFLSACERETKSWTAANGTAYHIGDRIVTEGHETRTRGPAEVVEVRDGERFPRILIVVRDRPPAALESELFW